MLVPCGPVGPPAPVNSGVRPKMLKHARKLLVFALANLLSLAISAVLAVPISLPFALLGGYLATHEAGQSLDAQNDIAKAVQGAGILVGVYGGFLAAFLCRAVEKRLFPPGEAAQSQPQAQQ
jgi:fructose-specific phosphotransferase system IIC component